MRLNKHPMLTVDGSVVVSFGIDPDKASQAQKARLVETGMSLRIVDDNGLEVGPVYPVPVQWLRESEDRLYFRGRLKFHHWNGPFSWYSGAWLRATPTDRTYRYIPRQVQLLLPFKRTAFGPALCTTIHFREFRVSQ